jgi:hypothetical protein
VEAREPGLEGVGLLQLRHDEVDLVRPVAGQHRVPDRRVSISPSKAMPEAREEVAQES